MKRDDFSDNNRDLVDEHLTIEERKAKPYYREWTHLDLRNRERDVRAVYRYTEEEGLRWNELWAESQKLSAQFQEMEFKLHSQNPTYGICPQCKSIRADKSKLSLGKYDFISPCKECGCQFCTYCSTICVDNKLVCECQPVHTFPLIQRKSTIGLEMCDIEKEFYSEAQRLYKPYP